MKTIYKYKVGESAYGDGIEVIEVPSSAEFLSVKRQGNGIFAWYMIDTEDETIRKDLWFRIGTGHSYSKKNLSGYKFADTIVCDDFGLVWHMFLKKGKELKNYK